MVIEPFNDELGFAALEAVEKASADDDVGCMVITGTGRAFSAGEDLGALQAGYEAGEPPRSGTRSSSATTRSSAPHRA